jgi:hypothetical protein
LAPNFQQDKLLPGYLSLGNLLDFRSQAEEKETAAFP